jgi:hypothetical protein
LAEKCDVIYLLDLDEFYSIEQILNIFKYIEKEEYITWFSTPMKNYIFDGKQYIEGFCPPRAFCNFPNSHSINKIYFDNDVLYSCGEGGTIDYKLLPNKSIPKNLINGGIKHLTWLHTNGKLKYEYQMKHFGHCGYKWNYESNLLEINIDYYKKYNLPLPEINYDN